jgi:hypothetical protein
MAENMPNLPSGALPPKPETSKIQPKKETVRINLPPKPSAAPTIKLPTLPPGGPSSAGPGSVPPPPPTSSGRAAPARAGAPATSSATAPRPPGQQRPAPRPAAAPTVSGLDKGLAIAAAVVALVAVGATVYLTWFTQGFPVATGY